MSKKDGGIGIVGIIGLTVVGAVGVHLFQQYSQAKQTNRPLTNVANALERITIIEKLMKNPQFRKNFVTKETKGFLQTIFENTSLDRLKDFAAKYNI